MNRTDGDRKELADWSSDRDLWRRSCLTDAPEDEAARLLDLAAFADGLLEPDERDRVAALLARRFRGSGRCRGGTSTPRCVSVGRSRTRHRTGVCTGSRRARPARCRICSTAAETAYLPWLGAVGEPRRSDRFGELAGLCHGQ